MAFSRLSHLLQPLQLLFSQREALIETYRRENNVMTAGVVCESLPFEVLASFGMQPFRIQASHISRLLQREPGGDITPEILNCYDHIIYQRGCCYCDDSLIGALPNAVAFNGFTGYGEDAAIGLHESLDALLRETGVSQIDLIDNERLRAATEPYDTMRRLVRGILTVRQHKPDLLSQADLHLIFEAALCLPVGLINEQLSAILDAMNSTQSGHNNHGPMVMVYAGMIDDPRILDEIEDAGCVVMEDDFCNGRRQFDLSYNNESGYLYYEILNSFSYKPLCACVRPAADRFELLYRLLRNYGIYTVIFLTDESCPVRNDQIEYLRVKLMRSGIDPVVTSPSSAGDDVRNYLAMASV